MNSNDYTNYKIYKFIDYEELPEFFKQYNNVWKYMGDGLCLLEEFNGKSSNGKNIEKLKDILLKYFDIRMDGMDGLDRLEPMKIYVGEYKIAFIEFSSGKIRVYIDCD